MVNGSKSNCKSASHKLFKDKAKNRVDDLQGVFSDLQFARKESRTIDVAVLEEQVHQMLREWKAELDEPSPASSLNGASIASFSSDVCRLLQLYEEEDDATSPLKGIAIPKSEPDNLVVQTQENVFPHHESLNVLHGSHDGACVIIDNKDIAPVNQEVIVNSLNVTTELDIDEFNVPGNIADDFFDGLTNSEFCTEKMMANISDFSQIISPPPSAFLGPKCALWDCPRPAQGADWCYNYCSSFHAALASNEGPPGMAPVLRPGGIGLKDGLLFAALTAKTEGKDVGIPECEGAATAKSPWNAPDLFDLSVLDGETIREWLFFDKPRRAFESGNRKQRSLPDYTGRGWHESRKQLMNEFGGFKRSYYMDPQPMENYEWHLYEYELYGYDVCALYRLELKLVNGKKNPRGKITTDSLMDLQKQMGRLSAKFPSVKGRTKASFKGGARNGCLGLNKLVSSDVPDFGAGAESGYHVENLSDFYFTCPGKVG